MRIDLDHFETIEELEIDLITWIKEEDLYSFDRYLNKEDILKIVQLLIKKENIIKEVKRLIEQRIDEVEDLAWVEMKREDYIDEQQELLGILDKENKDE